MRILFSLFLGFVAFGVGACSDESTTTVYVESPGFAELAQGETLPECSLKNEGELYFVADSSALFCCAKEKWRKVNQGRQNVDTIYVADTVVSKVTKSDTAYLGSTDTLDVGCSIALDTIDFHLIWVTCGDSVFSVIDERASRFRTQWGDPLTDARDGNTYKTVVINNQVWMAEDLKFGTDSTRDYTWLSAMGNPEGCDGTKFCDLGEKPQGACPVGWHIPNFDEWIAMSEYVNEHNGTEAVSKDLRGVDDELYSYLGMTSPGYDLFGLSVHARTLTSTQKGDSLFYVVDPTFVSATDELWIKLNRRVTDTEEKPSYRVRCLKND